VDEFLERELTDAFLKDRCGPALKGHLVQKMHLIPWTEDMYPSLFPRRMKSPDFYAWPNDSWVMNWLINIYQDYKLNANLQPRISHPSKKICKVSRKGKKIQWVGLRKIRLVVN